MSRRARAIGFALAAATAAVGAAAIADGYGRGVAAGYGELRPVVVAAAALPRGARIGPEEAAEALQVRRVPRRFVPAGALRDPAEALGLAAAAPIPAGSYVLAAHLRSPGEAGAGRPRLGGGRRPVELTVSGAQALDAAGARPGAATVDVVVTAEPTGGGTGRTYVAAAAVPLLGFAPAGPEAAEGTARVVLGLTRAQALRLIAAESFARKLTVLPRG